LSKFVYLANKSSFYNRLGLAALYNVTLGYTSSLCLLWLIIFP